MTDFLENEIKELDIEGYPVAYEIMNTGVTVREVTIPSVKKTENIVEIAMITDSHLKNTEHSIKALKQAVECASDCEQMVFCGDNIDAVSYQLNVDLFTEIVWNKYPDAICILGNHELLYGDQEQNRTLIDKIWPHNTVYVSKIIDDVVLICALDNSSRFFTEQQCDMLEKDIQMARNNGLAVLFFHHIVISALDITQAANERMYNILSSNGDVVRAIFAGHNHVDIVDEFSSSYSDENNNMIQTTIPCYRLLACGENGSLGNVLKITIRYMEQEVADESKTEAKTGVP